MLFYRAMAPVLRKKLQISLLLLLVFSATASAQWLTGYNNRIKITIPSAQISGSADHVDFPVLVSTTQNDLRDYANGGYVSNSSGYDIVFSENHSTILDFEREEYDPSSGELIAWVRIPTLEPGSDYEFYVYFNNLWISTDQSSPEDVWSSDYSAVWHMGDTNIYDATSNSFDGTNFGTSDAVGQIGQGRDFLPANDHIRLPENNDIVRNIGQVSMSAWVNNDNHFSTGVILGVSIFSGGGTTNSSRATIYINSSETISVGGRSNNVEGMPTTTSPSGLLPSSGWHYVVGIVDYLNDDLYIYIDGTQVQVRNNVGFAQNYADDSPSRNASIGSEDAWGSSYFRGELDEARVVKTALTADWIATEYNNQNAPGTFCQFGSIEIPNDDPCGAISVNVGSQCGDYTLYATNDPATAGAFNPACNWNAVTDKDVWFRFTIPASGRVQVNGIYAGDANMTDGAMAFYSGDDCSALTYLDCIDAGAMETYIVTGDPGDKIWLQYWGYGGDSGRFGICIFESPLPDEPCEAQFLPVNTVCTNSTFDNTYATTSFAGNPTFIDNLNDCLGWTAYNTSSLDLWFKFVVPASGQVTVEGTRNGGLMDGVMGIYSGACSSLTLINCDDDAKGGGNMPLLNLIGQTPGDTLWIQFFGYLSQAGSFDICVHDPSCSNITVDAGEDQLVCSGQTITLGGSTVASGFTGTPSYLWSPSTGLDDETLEHPEATVLSNTIYTVFVTDDNGCFSSDQVIVSVEDDDTDPILSCPGNQSEDTNVDCTYEVAGSEFDLLSASDNCTVVDTTYQLSGATIVAETSARTLQGVPFNLGLTTVTWRVYDGLGNNDNCVFTVTVADDDDPVINTCASDKDVVLDASCNFTLPDYTSDAALSITECSSYTVTQSPIAGSIITDTIVVTLTVTDFYSNSDQCTFNVNTLDTTNPLINTCATDKDVVLDASCNFTLPDYTSDAALSITECSAYSVTQSPAIGTVISDTTQVSLTVTDEYGNSAQCNFWVNTLDTTNPLINTCATDKDVVLDASCNFTLPDYTSDAVLSITECSAYTVTQSPAIGTVISDTTQVTLTVTDEYGNSAQCNFWVNTLDTTNPLINTCATDKDVVLDASCNFTLPDYTSDAALSITECSAYSVTQSPAIGTVISDTTQVTLTVTDEYGNSAQCNFWVNTLDTTNPLINTCATDKDVVLDASCNFTLPDYTSDAALSITECSAYSVAQSPAIGTVISDTTQVSLTVTDEYGNSAQCNFWVNTLDTTNPLINTCATDKDVVLDASCNFTLPDYTSDAALSITECSAYTVTQSPAIGTVISDTTQVSLTVTDEYGNSAQCNFWVNTLDTTNPLINTCATDKDVVLDASCNFTLPDYTSDAALSITECSAYSVAQSPAIGTVISDTTQVSLTVTDEYGNSAQCNFWVNTLDTTNPLINTCATDKDVVLDASCNFTLPDYTSDAALSITECSAYSVTQSPAIGTVISDTTQVSLTVTDEYGNSAQCNFWVNTLDTTNPLINTCATDKDVVLDASCNFTLPDYTSDAALSITECSAYSVTQSPAIGTVISDTTQVSLTVTDEYGNSAQCNFWVNTLDTTNPLINTCATDKDVVLDASCNFTLPDYTSDAALSITECSAYTVTQSPAIGTVISDTTQVTLTVTDEYGNSAQCNFWVNTLDTTNPLINTCATDKDVVLDASCNFTLPDYTSDAALSITECSAYSVTQSPAIGTVISDTTQVTLTVTDEYGNSAQCNFWVNTLDTTNPLINTCATDKDVVLDASCNFTLPDYTSDAALSITECSAYSVAQSPAIGTVISDTTQVSLTVTDEYGNSAQCNFWVNTLDTTNPLINTCATDKDVVLDASCNFTLPDYTSDAVLSITECSAYTVTQSPAIGTVISDTTQVSLTVTDEYGNSAQCNFWVNTLDTTNPLINTCATDKDVVLDASCNFTLPDYTSDAALSITECSAYTVTQSPAIGTVISDTTQVSLTVTDEYGNSAQCNFWVNTLDTTNPLINTCATDKDVVLDASCNFTLPDYTSDAALSITECSAYSVTQSPAIGTVISDTTQVTLTVTDEYGNSAQCNFWVNTLDTTNPLINTCATDKDVVLDASCNFTLPDYTSDAALSITECSAYSVAQSPAIGTVISDTTQVSLTVTDEYGNSAQCNFWVNTLDTTNPLINTCATDKDVVLDASCNFTLPDYTSDAALSITECSAYSVTQSPAIGTVISDTTQVSLTVTDEYGNSAQCNFWVNTLDTTNPLINTCATDKDVVLDASCNFTLPDYTSDAALSITECSAYSVTQSPAIGTVISDTTQVSLTVTDEYGNSAQCNFWVNTLDTTNPLINTCATDKDVVLDASCNFTLPDYTSDAALSITECSAYTVTQSPAIGTVISDTTQVTLTVTDEYGNSAQCNFWVNTLDTTNPLINTCATDKDVVLDASCNFTLPDYTSDAALSITECSAYSVTQSPAIGTVISDTTQVTLTVTDEYGNSAQCNFWVNTLDTTNPLINTCATDKDVVLDASCNFTLPDYTSDAALSITECSAYSVAQSPAIGTVISDTTQVSLTVTDEYGNSAQCNFWVNTLDTTNPLINTCATDKDVVLDASCNFTLPDYTSDAVLSITECSAYTVTQSPAIGTVISDTTQVSLTVTDEYGNSAQCNFWVNTLDTTNPLINTCATDKDVVLDASCNFTLPDYTSDAALSITECSAYTVTQSPAIGTVISDTTQVSLTVTDEYGNSAQCNFWVNTLDTTNPLINTCATDKDVVLDASCNFTLPDYTSDAALSITECSAYTVTQSPAIGTVISDTTQVTLTVTDEYGNSAQCNFWVNTLDTTNPLINTCATDKDVVLDASCNFTLPDYTSDAALSITECSAYSVTQLPAIGTVISDTTQVSLTVTDEYGNSAQCNFWVNTLDTTNPLINTCATDKDVVLDASCNFTLPDYTSDAALSITECSAYTVTQSPAIGTVISDTTQVSLTVTDEYGNSAQCNFWVNTLDTTNPLINTCATDKDVVLDASCNFTLPDYTSDAALSITECSAYSVTQSPAIGTVISDTTQVTLTVTDGYGNSAQCNFWVNTLDTTNPLINTCATDKDVVLDASCNFTLPDYTSDAVLSITECSAYTVTQSPAIGTVISDTTQVTLTVTDEYGNSAQCNFWVNTLDTTNPLINTCATDKDVVLDASCNFTLPDYTSDAALSITECSAYSVTQSPAIGTVISDTTQVSLTVTDEYGNSAQCNFWVNTLDTTNPLINTCATDKDVVLDASCNFTLPDYTSDAALSITECSAYTVTQSPAIGTVISDTTQVSLTVTDEYGNSAQCNFWVNTLDTTNPLINTCATDKDVVLDASCNFTLPDYTSDAALSITECSAYTVTQSPAIGTVISDTTQVTLTVTDEYGNSAQCNFWVNTIDNIPPVIICPANTTINCDDDSTPASTGIATATDNCNPVGTIVIDYSDVIISSGIPSNYIIQRTWSATDEFSNTSTCIQIITVQDVTAPTVVCQDIVVTLDLNTGLYTLDPALLDAGSTDNCDNDLTFSVSKDEFNCLDLGANIVTLYAEDDAGNIDSCQATVTVQYSIPPVVTLVASDTIICNDATTNIVLDNSFQNMTFKWTVAGDPEISGFSEDSLSLPWTIADSLHNSSDDVKSITYTITPYSYGLCPQADLSVTIYVEPTPTVYFVPASDTICDNDITDIELRSNNHPTHPIQFDYTVSFDSDSIAVTNINGGRTGFLNTETINEQLDNLGTNAQLVQFNVTPYTVDDAGIARCFGNVYTVDVWVEPTPTVYFVPASDTICDNDITDIELRSNNHPTHPIQFDYTVSFDSDSIAVTNINGGRTGFLNTETINEQLDNLGTNAQLVQFNVTPYTVDDAGIARCFGNVYTVDVWVEPTPTVYFVPASDTICDNDITDIELRSNNHPTHPIQFDYTVSFDSDSIAVTNINGGRTGFLNTETINEQLDNLGTNAQLVQFNVTPYTVDDAGIARCFGNVYTVDVWVEPTPTVYFVPASDTICDNDITDIELRSNNHPTHPIQFDYTVSFDSDSIAVTNINGGRTGFLNTETINEQLDNLGTNAQLVQFNVTPYTVDDAGIARCFGNVYTVDVWVEPTPTVYFVPASDTICDNDITDIELRSNNHPTHPIQFDYTVSFDSDSIAVTNINGGRTGFLNTETINEQLDNLGTNAQLVQFNVTPYTVDDAGIARCFGNVYTVDVWVEPTPTVYFVPASDTICDNDITDIELRSNNHPTHPIQFDYTVSFDSDSIAVTNINGGRTGFLNTETINEQLDNLGTNAQLVQFNVTPYTVDDAGIARCFGNVYTVDVWVEPTPTVYFVPASDTICDNDITDIELRSNNHPTHPIQFDYTVSFDSDSIAVTNINGGRTGFLNTETINEQLDNLGTNAQLVQFNVTPYTVDDAGIARCFGNVYTVDVWVEPTPTVYFVPASDTICDNDITDIELRSNNHPTHPIQFDYTVSFDSDSIAVTNINGGRTGFLNTETINEQLDNLGTNAQLVQFNVTPYTVDDAGIARCFGNVYTVDVWVEPTPTVYFVPASDTICDNDITDIELRSNNHPTHPIQFDYAVSFDSDSIAVTNINGGRTGFLNTETINEQLDNLGTNAQLVQFNVTPYTVDDAGIARCFGNVYTVDVWVEPTPTVYFVPASDTICDNDITDIELRSNNHPTHPIQFDYTVSFDSDSIAVTNINGGRTGFLNTETINEQLDNLGTNAQLVQFNVTPYTVDDAGIARCFGNVYTVDVWVEPTPTVYFVPASDTICDNDITDIELRSNNHPTHPIQFDYTVSFDSDSIAVTNINGGRTGFLNTETINEQLDNLGTNAQLVQFNVTPYTVDDAGIARCFGNVYTVDVWVEPTPTVYFVPASDTICDNDITDIELRSNNHPTHPIQFDYTVSFDSDSIAVTNINGGRTGFLNTETINEQLDNLGTNAQLVQFNVTPYTVDDAGIARCFGNVYTVDVWVEPTPTVYFVPASDTICDNDITDIELRSNNHPTHPIQFDYTVSFDSDSIAVTNINGGRTGFLNTETINEQLDNLGTNAQLVQFNVTPYTVDDAGIARCFGNVYTVDVWVEPTPTVYFVPASDTICDNDITDIELRSNNHPTHPIQFDYTVSFDSDSIAVTNINGGRTGFLNTETINEQLDNLGTNAQLVQFNVTPYTVDDAGIARCFGNVYTVDVWVEPTPTVYFVPASDTICDNDITDIELRSNNHPTHPIQFDYTVSFDSDSIAVTNINGGRTGFLNTETINEQLDNLGTNAQLVQFNVTPYTVDDAGIARCFGNVYTVDVWVEPTPTVYFVPASDTICDNDITDIELRSNNHPTHPIQFDYTVSFDSDSIAVTNINGGRTGFLNTETINEQLDNLGTNAQLVQFNVTPYTVDDAGIARCFGNVYTVDVWVEPTPTVYFVPASDTICDNDITDIELRSNNHPTHPIQFDYTVSFDSDSIAVTNINGGRTGFLNTETINEQLDNLGTNAQLVQFNVTPYTVDDAGIARCFGNVYTVDVWVEPTPTVYFVPASDTICDNDITDIELRSNNHPTHPIQFDYTVSFDSDSIAVTNINGGRTGFLNTETINEQLDNLGTNAQLVQFNVTPYTVDDAGIARCFGNVYTVDVWVEPTPTVYFVPASDTICDNDITDIELRSNNHPTHPIQFDYTVSFDSDSIAVTNINGGRTGFLNTETINEQLDNLGTNAQLVQFNVTPYTVDDAGIARCFGNVYTVDVWVEPTPTVYFVPASDTICDNDITDIELRSNNHPTHPIQFDYTVSFDSDSIAVTNINGGRTGFLNTETINEQLDNLGTNAQLVQFNVTPYTVDDAGIARCFGNVYTVDVWVEPTAYVKFEIANDTLCNNENVIVSFRSANHPTIGLRFDIEVINNYPGDISGPTARLDLSTIDNINELLTNSGDTARMIQYVIVPFTVYPDGSQKCAGIRDTIDVWINPTPRVTPFNWIERMCFGASTDIELRSPTLMTHGNIEFDYTIALSDGAFVSGNTTALSDKRIGDHLVYPYENADDTIQSVFYYITPKNVETGCSNGVIETVEVKLHPIPIRRLIVTKPLTCREGSDMELAVILSRGTSTWDAAAWASEHDSIYWDGPLSIKEYDTDTISGLPQGKYTVEVWDNLGCRADSSITRTKPRPGIIFDPILKVPYIAHTECVNSNDGEIELAITEGEAFPYTYWVVREGIDTVYTGTLTKLYEYTDPTSSDIISNLAPGNYSLILLDINGCIDDETETEVQAPNEIQADLEAYTYPGGFNISCKGYNDGQLSVTNIFGGSLASGEEYRFLWTSSDGSIPGDITNDTISGLITGTYTVSVFDRYDCVFMDSITLIEPDGITLLDATVQVYADGSNISCNGFGDGSIDLTFEGGSGVYYYNWTGPSGFISNTEDISGLYAGDYSLVVTDENGCSMPFSYTITEPDTLNIVFAPSETFDGLYNINCNGGLADIDITPEGGALGGYTYTWTTSNGSGLVENDEDQTDLSAGTYRVSMIDANTCFYEDTIMLIEPEPLSSSVEITNITCESAGRNNGSIDLTVNGGADTHLPYTFSWSETSTSEDISGLTEGRYYVTITDAYGCSIMDSGDIQLPPPLEINKTISDYNGMNIRCFEDSNGSIDIEVSSGNGPYSFTWTGPEGFVSGEESLSGLTAGMYIVNIIDQNLCEVTDTSTLIEAGRLGITADLSESDFGGYSINCYGDLTGSIELGGINGVGDMAFLWTDGYQGQNRDYLPAGDYGVLLVDDNNCTRDTVVTLTEPEIISVLEDIVQPYCVDMPDGIITLTASGGFVMADYFYEWSDNTTGNQLQDIAAGNYVYSVTDDNGCVLTDTIEVSSEKDNCLTIPNAISPNGDNVNDVWNIDLIHLYPDAEVKIFNRWSELLWASENGYPQPWNGTSKGRELPIDSYHYIINLHNGRKLIRGHITIIR